MKNKELSQIFNLILKMRENLLFIKMLIYRREQKHFYLNPYIIDGHMHKHIHFYCWLKYVMYILQANCGVYQF